MSIFTPRPQGLRLVHGAGPAAAPSTERRDFLPGLWERASVIWEDIAGLWGSPSDIAMQGGFRRRDIAPLWDWLRHLELLVRRLIFIAALAFDPGPPPCLSAPSRCPRERRLRGVVSYPDKPEAWRVHFAMTRRPPRGDDEPVSRRDPEEPSQRGPRSLCDAWPVALRFNSLFHVIENPEPHILRLARRLARIRAGATSANRPHRLAFSPWNPAARDRSLGQRAIDGAMRLAQPEAERVLDRWQPPEPD